VIPQDSLQKQQQQQQQQAQQQAQAQRHVFTAEEEQDILLRMDERDLASAVASCARRLSGGGMAGNEGCVAGRVSALLPYSFRSSSSGSGYTIKSENDSVKKTSV